MNKNIIRSGYASFGGVRNPTPDQALLSKSVDTNAQQGKPNRDRKIGKSMGNRGK